LGLIRAPHYGANFAADYVIPSSVGDFDLDVNVSYTDSFYGFPDESMKQPVVNLLNASMKWTHSSRRYDLRLAVTTPAGRPLWGTWAASSRRPSD
jgi:hypothetical protein